MDRMQLNPIRPSEIANNTQVPGRKQLSCRSKSCQSKSVSSNAKNIYENNDSEIRRIAEDVLVAAKKRHIEMTVVESDYVTSGTPVSVDLNIKSNSHKDVKNISSYSQKIQQFESGRRSRREGSLVLAIKDSLQGEGLSCQYKEAASEKCVMNYDDPLKKNDLVDENSFK
ncbi:hypothetical protein CQW23_12477 [Capsicum baccatum]|uniref:Uncharacterized protein n=1 Tax=Capsicum baccatum TaxID=33114 RepID=A0A2G2WSW5_CAPBA|nr:hypothetical protein CQW23_12477 [Capsicum baccatum]